MSDTKLERIFCAEQIHVPPELPNILKQFTKEVIRHNPVQDSHDEKSAKLALLQFGADYFTKLAEKN